VLWCAPHSIENSEEPKSEMQPFVGTPIVLEERVAISADFGRL